MYLEIYSELPQQLLTMAETPAMRRLKHVGMHCGCEYTAYPIYRKATAPYSRYTHSLGTAAIVWHFTRDLKQAVAAMLHDIATPAFAHVVDFLNGDHLRQESTESRTRMMIASSPELMALLNKSGLTIDDVDDYHRYHYLDSGAKGENIFLPGKLHTVRPIALLNRPVFCENSREYTVLDTDHFGTVVQVEVGALMVGRICNLHGAGPIQRGAEKGRFEFGGSTVITLFQKDTVQPDPSLLTRTAVDQETPLQCGAVIGHTLT